MYFTYFKRAEGTLNHPKSPLLPQLLEDGISSMVYDVGKHEWSSYGHAKVRFHHLLCLGVALGV